MTIIEVTKIAVRTIYNLTIYNTKVESLDFQLLLIPWSILCALFQMFNDEAHTNQTKKLNITMVITSQSKKWIAEF